MPKKLSTLEDLYFKELKDLHSAENQILKALPKMIKKANSRELKDSLGILKMETEEQVKRLEKIFKRLGKNPLGKKCKAMECIIEEGKELLEQNEESSVLDAGLIATVQKIEHYEISAYGTAKTYAQLLGYDDARDMLQYTLDEESSTDEKLSGLAEEIDIEITQS